MAFAETGVVASPSALRALRRARFEERLPKLLAIIDNKESSDADVTRAIDLLARYGLGTRIGIVDDDGNAQTGIIVLPELDLRGVQHAVHGRYPAGTPTDEPSLERVEETVDVLQRHDRDEPAPPIPPEDETVDPKVAAMVRARSRRNLPLGVA